MVVCLEAMAVICIVENSYLVISGAARIGRCCIDRNVLSVFALSKQTAGGLLEDQRLACGDVAMLDISAFNLK